MYTCSREALRRRRKDGLEYQCDEDDLYTWPEQMRPYHLRRSSCFPELPADVWPKAPMEPTWKRLIATRTIQWANYCQTRGLFLLKGFDWVEAAQRFAVRVPPTAKLVIPDTKGPTLFAKRWRMWSWLCEIIFTSQSLYGYLTLGSAMLDVPRNQFVNVTGLKYSSGWYGSPFVTKSDNGSQGPFGKARLNRQPPGPPADDNLQFRSQRPRAAIRVRGQRNEDL